VQPEIRYRCRTGLSVPLITVLDSDGKVLEDEQRAVVRHAIQAEGDDSHFGADIVFAAGTTGEWDRMDNRSRQLVARLAVEECRRSASRAVEAWVGITAPTRAEMLDNLAHAIEIKADAAVVAPLSIGDAANPVDVIVRDIADFFERRSARIPVFLYDNADIAAPGKAPHMHTREVKQMSQLDFVHGVKVTASKSVLGNYTRAASHFKSHGEFGIYTGNAYLIFDLFARPAGIGGWARNLWNRYWTRSALPAGVVAGPANVLPREWQRAWQVSLEGNQESMHRYARVLDAFRAACEFKRDGRSFRPTIACLKTALVRRGVCLSDAVAPGTAALDAGERAEFFRRMDELDRLAAATLEPLFVSRAESSTASTQRIAHHA
jgi:dihydrodipicolinate synthase/N-acetylneuraminate lyase